MIQVLMVNIGGMESAFLTLYAAATEGRRLRADRYLHKEDALRCLTCDALLRYVLGTADYQTEAGPQGKPHIKGRPDFHYNLSHSGNWVVLAWGDSQVGVDVEKISMSKGKEAIARQHFTPEEQRYIFEDPALTTQRFFRVWTGKESYLKYLGTGLTRSLASFSVLSLKERVCISHRILPGEYSLSLCTAGEEISFRVLDAQQLL